MTRNSAGHDVPRATQSDQDHGVHTVSPVGKTTGEGLSRRDMIKGAAVAGAAAWTAPMIIDSLTSPAAAVSGGVTCSWFYVVFKKPGSSTVYWTGGSTGTACGTFSTNNAPTVCKTCNGVTYTMLNGGQGNMTYGTTCGSGTSATAAGATCGTYISVSGNTVTAINGATILAAFSHPSNTLNCSVCPTTLANNSITVCGAAGNCDPLD
jgi:hypothetical protein